MSQVARAAGISRPHLSASARGGSTRRSRYAKQDEDLLDAIKLIVAERPTYGYRRVTALLNRRKQAAAVNHKRVYRVMRDHHLLLQRFGPKPVRPHDGKVMTLHSNTRWCSDGFQVRCWSGEKVHVAFVLDCCDREVIGWTAAARDLDGQDVRDMLAAAVEERFGCVRAPRAVEWLTDNGPQFVAHDTRDFARTSGLLPRNTPAYSPESNGMAEAFVKTFKRDYVYVSDVASAAQVLDRLGDWFEDYNDHHPHKALNMASPRGFRAAVSSG